MDPSKPPPGGIYPPMQQQPMAPPPGGVFPPMQPAPPAGPGAYPPQQAPMAPPPGYAPQPMQQPMQQPPGDGSATSPDMMQQMMMMQMMQAQKGPQNQNQNTNVNTNTNVNVAAAAPAVIVQKNPLGWWGLPCANIFLLLIAATVGTIMVADLQFRYLDEMVDDDGLANFGQGVIFCNMERFQFGGFSYKDDFGNKYETNIGVVGGIAHWGDEDWDDWVDGMNKLSNSYMNTNKKAFPKNAGDFVDKLLKRQQTRISLIGAALIFGFIAFCVRSCAMCCGKGSITASIVVACFAGLSWFFLCSTINSVNAEIKDYQDETDFLVGLGYSTNVLCDTVDDDDDDGSRNRLDRIRMARDAMAPFLQNATATAVSAATSAFVATVAQTRQRRQVSCGDEFNIYSSADCSNYCAGSSSISWASQSQSTNCGMTQFYNECVCNFMTVCSTYNSNFCGGGYGNDDGGNNNYMGNDDYGNNNYNSPSPPSHGNNNHGNHASQALENYLQNLMSSSSTTSNDDKVEFGDFPRAQGYTELCLVFVFVMVVIGFEGLYIWSVMQEKQAMTTAEPTFNNPAFESSSA